MRTLLAKVPLRTVAEKKRMASNISGYSRHPCTKHLTVHMQTLSFHLGFSTFILQLLALLHQARTKTSQVQEPVTGIIQSQILRKIPAPGSCTVSENPDPKVVQLYLIALEKYISTLNSLLLFKANNRIYNILQ